MADYDFDQFEAYSDADASGFGMRARRWTHIAGAVSSVALILGLGIWGYRLAVRDVTGVPVMRAMAGAMRIAPADPGGAQALNQGLTVNAVAAMGSALPAAEQITLAPAPATLLPEDAAPADTQVAEVQAADGVAQALLLADPEDAAATEPELIASAPVEDWMQPGPSVLENPNVIRTSLRPQARPHSVTGGLQLKAVQTVSGTDAAAPATPAFQAIEAASIPKGTPLVQFGVFETPEAAQEHFVSLSSSFPEIMGSLTPVVFAAQSSGRNFYRLRAEGYATLDEAREFCKGIPESLSSCIPLVVK